ncbi:mitochondrial tRNA methylthiotransferase CDK5RAP1 [Dermatophagoides farinae]|uniref:mitochondrial tRNA methylthiotransferase CDK5RAP1 n=1 Tax=Dermatophagoides farinae TaxID=6954 RepID=UPI003F5EFBE9
MMLNLKFIQKYRHLNMSMSLMVRNFCSQQKNESNRRKIDGPDLQHFLRQAEHSKRLPPFVMKWDNEPYIEPKSLSGNNSKVFIKTYGCQMNVNDTEIASTILEQYDYKIVTSIDDADIVLLMTCAIRENAENKVWSKLYELDKVKRMGQLKKFGLLGCMAERLKKKIVEQLPSIDVVAGPDSYRYLPKLLAINSLNGQSAINVLLSLDETYADVIPRNQSGHSAYVSITRGCNNMCSYCIVPYTRGRERSRSIDSILREVEHKINSGIKEIILLGQNVNSYRDYSIHNNNDDDDDQSSHQPSLADGFKTLYRLKSGGAGFDELLRQVARINRNVRIRFTSPHPKDFNDSVLRVIADHSNIAKGLHLPVQSGSNFVLERMRRGYTREAYLQLVKRIRHYIPDCGLSSDFICGFCDETDDDHRQTIEIIQNVGYYIAYIFAYSMRDKTYAYHHLNDNVPQSIKIQRLIELNQVYRQLSNEMNRQLIGRRQLILVEGISKKSSQDVYGRNEANQKVIIPKSNNQTTNDIGGYDIGDFLDVQITDSTPVTLMARPIRKTSITEFYE